MKRRFLYIINSLIFFTVGCIVTIILKKVTQFTISSELDLPDLISIVVTIILAFYIGLFVEKDKENERIRKDTIIVLFKEYDELLKEKVTEILNDNDIGLRRKVSAFKILRARLHNLNNMAIEKNVLKKDNNITKEITKEVSRIWDLSTGDNIKDQTRRNENIELSLLKIDDLFYKLILQINDI